MKIAKVLKKPFLSSKDIGLIVKLLGIKNVSSIILYGSQLSGNASKESDIDLLVIITHLDKLTIEGLIGGKRLLEEALGLPVSLNIHTVDEVNPLLKKKNIFMHKNRSEFMIYKYKYHYLCIYGNNPFEAFANPSPKQIREEAIKLLLSFSYNLKKFILNPELAPHKEREFIRTPLISLEYIAAFYGYISLDKYDAFNFLERNKLIENKHKELIKRISKKNLLSDDEKVSVIDFLDFYRKILIDKYLHSGQSDIRYVSGRNCFHWDLKYPQAVSMGIVLQGDKILLLRRTPDDYLYPNLWTLPGGYLKKEESFEDCVLRELFEETGLRRLGVQSLFNNKKIITKRVAIGCFLINSLSGDISISEHSSYKFIRIDEIKNYQLTPECKKVLDKYFSL